MIFWWISTGAYVLAMGALLVADFKGKLGPFPDGFVYMWGTSMLWAEATLLIGAYLGLLR